MRKARKWYAEWQINSFEDIHKVGMAFGAPENAWFRQVLTYWENAASLVLRGAVQRELFMDWNGEMIFTFVKIKPYLKQMRETSGNHDFLAGVEKLLNSTPELRKKAADLEQRLKQWNEIRGQAAGKS